jgi:hypothetical protein
LIVKQSKQAKGKKLALETYRTTATEAFPGRTYASEQSIRVLTTPFSYNASELANLETALSLDRFSKYVGACSGDRRQALKLYEWNSRVSASFYVPLQIVEVALRNACHRELCNLFGLAWHDEPDFLKLLERRTGQVNSGRIRSAAAVAAYSDLVPVIQQLRADGNSWRAVASSLNDSGETTATGGTFTAMQCLLIIRRAAA